MSLWGLALGFTVGYVFPTFASQEMFQDGGEGLLGAMLLPFSLAIDAIILAAFGNTPGRALAGIRVEKVARHRLDAVTALSRNARVWFFGMAIGFPLFALVAYARHYSNLKSGGQTSWDTMLETRVHNVNGSARRTALTAVLWLALIAIPTVFVAAQEQRFAAERRTMTQDAPVEVAAPNSIAPAGDPIAAELQVAAASIKPKMIDSITRLDSGTAEGRTFTYHYTILRRDASDERFKEFFNSTTRPNVCANSDLGPLMRDYGITYIYEYSMPNTVQPLTFQIVWADCKS